MLAGAAAEEYADAESFVVWGHGIDPVLSCKFSVINEKAG
jgi:hypothetical protein